MKRRIYTDFRILIVDTDHLARSRLRSTTPQGSICVEADNERAAVAAFATAIDDDPFDVVLLSRELTRMGELNTVDAFRAIEKWMGIPEGLQAKVVFTPCEIGAGSSATISQLMRAKVPRRPASEVGQALLVGDQLGRIHECADRHASDQSDR